MTRTWARGVTTAYSYDAAGLLLGTDYGDLTPDVLFAYDRLGRQISAITTVSTNFFSYASYSGFDLESEIQNGSTITRSQDAFGRSVGFNLGIDYEFAYDYNESGRVSSLSSLSFSVSTVAKYDYLIGTDMIKSMTNTDGLTWTRTFESNRDRITIVSNRWNDSSINVFDYVNDPVGRHTQRTDFALGSAVTNTFHYNARSEVSSASMYANTYGYIYDPIGNRVQSAIGNGTTAMTNTYEASALNQYSIITCQSNSLQTNALSYDLDGNMLTNGVMSYTWDAENRLVSVCSNGVTLVSNTFDHKSRRIMKNSHGGSDRTEYLYDGWNLVREIQHPGFPTDHGSTNFYFWGFDHSRTFQGVGGVGGLLAVITTSSNQYNSLDVCFPSCDANGNVVDYIRANGTVVAHFEYDAFGNTVSQSGERADDFMVRFSTKPLDAEISLYYYGYRYYSPQLGRWLSRDPIGDRGGNNLYLTVDNDLINKIDVLGLYVDTTGVVVPGDGYIYCEPSSCTLKPGGCANNKAAPEDCCIAHENSHIGDTLPETGCYRDACKRCVSAGMTPTFPDDYTVDLQTSECKAYVESIKCCAKKIGLYPNNNNNVASPMSSEKRQKYAECIVTAKIRRGQYPGTTPKCPRDPVDDIEVTPPITY